MRRVKRQVQEERPVAALAQEAAASRANNSVAYWPSSKTSLRSRHRS